MGLQIMQVHRVLAVLFAGVQHLQVLSNVLPCVKLLSLLQVEAVIDFLAGVGVKGPDATKVRTVPC